MAYYRGPRASQADVRTIEGAVAHRHDRPARDQLASNFQLDRLYGSYEALWSAYAAIVSDMTDAEQAGLFRHDAERIYRI
jgi:predicted TIM-barrel fold metal-dependent hydrolase